MKTFSPIKFDPEAARIEVAEFRDLLDSKASLKEREEILPFFRGRPQLSALIGGIGPDVFLPDRLAWELQLFGEYACDLAVGDSASGEFCLVEFEDAAPGSIFTAVKGKSTPEWSRRFERGFGQIIDWFRIIDDLDRTDLLRSKFGVASPYCAGLLVIGRSHDLYPTLRERLAWRSRHVVVRSKRVVCMTFDELYQNLAIKLNLFGHVTGS
jgi:hypothetical protein